MNSEHLRAARAPFPAGQSGPRPRRHVQRGAVWGNLLVFGVLIGLAVVGIKMVPVYIDSMSVKEGLNSMMEQDLASMKKSKIREMLLKRYDISAVKSVTSRNFDEVGTIEKKDGRVRIHLKYREERKLFGNVSLVVDFEHEAEK